MIVLSLVLTLFVLSVLAQETKKPLISTQLDDSIGLPSNESIVLSDDDSSGFLDVYHELTDDTENLTDDIRNSESSASDTVNTIGTDEILEIPDNESGFSDMYVELSDDSLQNESLLDESLLVEYSEIDQGDITIGQSVYWYQNITLTNLLSEPTSFIFELSPSEIGEDFLSDVDYFEIYQDGMFVSTDVFLVELDSNETITYQVTYRTPPVQVSKECREEHLSDLIPADAVIISSDLDLDTKIRTVCDIKVFHDTVTHYTNLVIPLDGIDPNDVDSIFYVEGGIELDMKDGVVLVPEFID